MADVSQMKDEAFPAPSKQANGLIDGVETEAMVMHFSDKIMVTLSQEGRLSQWIQVPLLAPSPAAAEMPLPNPSLLPLAHLTPRTLLGGGGEERESSGQLYAAQIASHIARKNSEEGRTLLVGLGLQKPTPNRESFFDLIELIQKVL
ncbi:uncharacterized protein PG998_007401 [Apiospora kogelbergensis]|uniref:Proteasome assembly chaperone 3 n=1 Tax=Apiospora kogelbergensis TaxID=1337665 RepID=A0AAW0QEM2_9PEZI